MASLLMSGVTIWVAKNDQTGVGIAQLLAASSHQLRA